MVADKEISVLGHRPGTQPHPVEMDEYGSRLELLIYFLTWAVELGLCFAFAISYLRG